MTTLADIANPFVDMAHRIVWCTVATVDASGRPRTRILHPLWIWDGETLVGWVATGPTSPKTRHLASTPFVSLTYWAPNHDTCTADCEAEMVDDVDVRTWLWDAFKTAPAPVGYDPAIIPQWAAGGPNGGGFGALRLEPTALRLLPQMDFSKTMVWKR